MGFMVLRSLLDRCPRGGEAAVWRPPAAAGALTCHGEVSFSYCPVALLPGARGTYPRSKGWPSPAIKQMRQARCPPAASGRQEEPP
ncbi:hypothetical protein SAT01_28530 [Sinomonas atrocyanea]|nr:hypothetical protein SAT01_28530 [Sinomonas atrocyanea]GGG66087.1 hypothetical protein GCM10007172_17060 [Sinomonas atrocyanea]